MRTTDFLIMRCRFCHRRERRMNSSAACPSALATNLALLDSWTTVFSNLFGSFAVKVYGGQAQRQFAERQAEFIRQEAVIKPSQAAPKTEFLKPTETVKPTASAQSTKSVKAVQTVTLEIQKPPRRASATEKWEVLRDFQISLPLRKSRE